MSLPWQLQLNDPISRLQHIFETKVLSDCTLLIGKGNGQLVEGHKLILSIASPVLHEKLKAAGGDKPKITLTDVEPEVFQSMLKYIYVGSTDINDTTVCDLATAAKTYRLPSLLKACLDHIIAASLTPKNVLHTYGLALHVSENDCKEKCEEVIKTRTKEVLTDSSFEEESLEVIEAVFSLEHLDIDSELELLNALDRYAKHVSTCDYAGNTHIRDVLAKIRFLSLTPEEFAKAQTTTSVLSAGDACAILAHLVYDKSVIPMPSGFSLRRDARKTSVSELKFKFSVPNIEDFVRNKSDIWSSIFVLRELKWKMHIRSRTVNSKDYLGIFVYCNWESRSDTWSCYAKVEFLLLRTDDGLPYDYKYSHRFNKSDSNWGFHDFIKTSDLLNPNYHFIKDGAITLEFRIKADEPHGL